MRVFFTVCLFIICSVVGFSQDYAQAYYEAGKQYQAIKDFESAALYYQKALQLNPAHDQALFNTGICYMNSAQYSKAQLVWRQYLLRHPTDHEAQLLAARTAVQHENWLDVIYYYEQVGEDQLIESDQLHLAQAFVKRSKYDRCSQIIKSLPNSHEKMVVQAQLSIADKKYEEAERLLNQLIYEHKASAKVYVYQRYLAQIYGELKQYRKAENIYQQLYSLTKNSNDLKSANQMLFYETLERPNESGYQTLQNQCRAILNMNPEDTQTQHILALALLYSKAYNKALLWTNEAILREPKNDDFWNTKGLILIALQQTANAKDCFNKAIEYNPLNKEAQQNLDLISTK